MSAAVPSHTAPQHLADLVEGDAGAALALQHTLVSFTYNKDGSTDEEKVYLYPKGEEEGETKGWRDGGMEGEMERRGGRGRGRERGRLLVSVVSLE